MVRFTCHGHVILVRHACTQRLPNTSGHHRVTVHRATLDIIIMDKTRGHTSRSDNHDQDGQTALLTQPGLTTAVSPIISQSDDTDLGKTENDHG